MLAKDQVKPFAENAEKTLRAIYGDKAIKASELNDQQRALIIFEGDNEMTFVFVAEMNDPGFVRIILPNFYSVKEDTKLKAWEQITRLNGENKLAKVYLDSDLDAAVAVEMLAESENYVTGPLIRRCLNALLAAAKEFRDSMDAQSSSISI